MAEEVRATDEQVRKLRDALDRIHEIVAKEIVPIIEDGDERLKGETFYRKTAYGWFLYGLFRLCGTEPIRRQEREDAVEAHAQQVREVHARRLAEAEERA